MPALKNLCIYKAICAEMENPPANMFGQAGFPRLSALNTLADDNFWLNPSALKSFLHFVQNFF